MAGLSANQQKGASTMDQATIDKVSRWLRRKRLDRKCRACRSLGTGFECYANPIRLMSVDSEGRASLQDRGGIRLVVTVCKNCGHTNFYSLAVMGIEHA
jgi:hypothetical protein